MKRAPRFLLVLAALSVMGSALNAVSTGPEAGVVTGTVRVVDGDTLDVGGTRVRLHGIDAPERDQTCATRNDPRWACGGWVTRVAQDEFAGRQARCAVRDTDRYGRTVAQCVVAGRDIGGWLVSQGMAFAYVKYGADYIGHQRAAEAAQRGLHRVRMISPQAHRRAGRTAPTALVAGCAIKGNINSRGERIYHVPGQAFYSGTRISATKGERWFCTPAQAEAAGWRAAKR